MWRVRKSNGSGESGFSLLEVIVAMGILSVGLLAIATAQISALKLARQSRYLTHSMNLAQDQMELFQLAQTASLPADGTYNDPNNPLDPDPFDPDVSTYNRRWTITTTSASCSFDRGAGPRRFRDSARPRHWHRSQKPQTSADRLSPSR